MKDFKPYPGARLGMTYVEVLIYLFVIGVTLLVFMLFAASLLYDRTRGASIVETQEQARFAMTRLERDITDARTINAASSTFGVNLALPQYGGSVVSFAHASSTRNPTEFSVQDGVLMVRYGNATATPLTADSVRVSQLLFWDTSSGRSKSVSATLSVEFVNSTTSYIFGASSTLRSAMELRAP